MTELVVALGLIAGVVGVHEIGFWLGSLTRSADEPFDRQVALVRTSTAALVAFLIGFAFSGAASRFIDRLDVIVKEANALGTAYLRADIIAEPQRGELKAALKEYTADRVTLLSREGRDQIEPLLDKVSGLHERMWRSGVARAASAIWTPDKSRRIFTVTLPNIPASRWPGIRQVNSNSPALVNCQRRSPCSNTVRRFALGSACSMPGNFFISSACLRFSAVVASTNHDSRCLR